LIEGSSKIQSYTTLQTETNRKALRLLMEQLDMIISDHNSIDIEHKKTRIRFS
jgi:hypothetical protein